MARHTVRGVLASLIVAILAPVSTHAGAESQARGGYQVVKVCSLLSLAEVKKLAPWAPHMDQFAEAEEEAIGTRGSSCNYPTAHVQVMAFSQQMLDGMRKAGATESVAGVGGAAYVRNNRNLFAEIIATVGPHLLTVQMGIGPNETYATAKPKLIALAKAFAAKLAPVP
jgi:hypothetical protein